MCVYVCVCVRKKESEKKKGGKGGAVFARVFLFINGFNRFDRDQCVTEPLHTPSLNICACLNNKHTLKTVPFISRKSHKSQAT